jgi:hypothetical protein
VYRALRVNLIEHYRLPVKVGRLPTTLKRIAMLKKPTYIIALMLSTLCLASFNSAYASAVYSINLKKKLNGTKIYAETSKINAPGSLTVLKLSNFDSREVDCKASFNPRIEQEKSYKRRLQANTNISIRYTSSRTPNRLNIKLVCRAVDEIPAKKD